LPEHIPLPLNREQLLTLMNEVRRGIESGDTLEGWIEFTLPAAPTEEVLQHGPKEWLVKASYRVGNREGRSGLVNIGRTNEDG
jgi:hypothetical protein